MIAVFAKAPVPGRVKTRLAAALGASYAARLHEAFVADTLELAMATGERVELHTDVPTAAWPEFLGTRRLQSAGDLGNRMLTALAGAGEPCMILGSDAPGLPLAYLKRLLAAASDVALGPADDGGYYAILAHRTHPAMFAGVEWSTAQTLAQTRAAVEQCGLSIELGDPWFDVDTPDDFTRLLQSPTLPPHTANFLRRSAPRGI